MGLLEEEEVDVEVHSVEEEVAEVVHHSVVEEVINQLYYHDLSVKLGAPRGGGGFRGGARG